MKSKFIMLCIMFVASVVFANDITPGSYVVSLKWDQGGHHYCRLAMYSFRTDYTIRSDYWQYNELSSKTCADANPIGTTSQPGVPATDSSCNIQGLSHYLGSNLSTRYGTWALYSGGIVGIFWSNGDEEYWRRTWYETKLTKIECYYADYADSPWTFYLYNNAGTFQRLDSAINAGFGFGGSSTPGFTTAKTSMTSFNKNYTGRCAEWNCIIGAHLPVEEQQLNMLTYPYLTDPSGIWRLVTEDTERDEWVFSYLGIKGGSGMYARRMAYQCSHDYDNPANGNIEDDRGHIQMGLQILDTSSAGRGFVMCQTGPTDYWPPYTLGMISALFYFDNWTTAAQTGICAN